MDRNIGIGTEKRAQTSDNTQRIKEWFFICVSHWKWFVLSLLVCLGGAFLHLKRTPNVYTRTVSILVKQGGENSPERQLKELGIVQTSSNMTNEMLSIQTSVIAQKIVRRLNLEVDYLQEGIFHDEVIYGMERPVTMTFDGLNDNENVSLLMTRGVDSTVVISEMKRGGMIYDTSLRIKLGELRDTPLGKIMVSPTPYYSQWKTKPIKVVRSTLNSTANSVRGRISVRLRDNNSTIIDISYRDVSIARAEDVLNTLVAVYNENWVKDRNQITVSTNEFIKERLAVIEQELGNVEQDISNYKSEHLMPDVVQVGSQAMNQASTAEQESNALSNQIYMVRYIRSYLVDGRHENQLLPSNSGIGSSTIGRQISEYNEILLRRNNHLANSSLQNPLVMDLDQHLATLRNSIIQSLDNELAILTAQQQSVMSSHRQAVAKIASNPQQAKYLLSVERQQKVKESLYLFLLQKREENELSQAFTAYNTQLIEPPHGSMAPTSPSGSMIFLYAFCIGLGLPAAFFFGKEALNNTVRGRKELKAINVPFAGEIPFVGKKKLWFKPRKQERNESPRILVADKSRDLINEAFRVVRTNLEFMLGFKDGHHVIMTTSISPGSGKTFFSANIANSLGIKEKKVIAIDVDLRKASLSEYVSMPHRGIANYLSGQESEYQKLIVHQNSIDILPCGTLPPNPTELLASPRFKIMLDELRRQYDYVFIDCPPVDIVADTAIINRYVDLTFLIVRSGTIERSLLPDIENWYNEKKYKNMALVLNATENTYGYYSYHRYGYYGKGYAYGK